MISITVILKGDQKMNKAAENTLIFKESGIFGRFFGLFRSGRSQRNKNRVIHPFWIIVRKEISDHVNSWTFIILLIILALTTLGSLYTALSNLRDAVNVKNPEESFIFLKLFTATDGNLPAFFIFLGFLGPLLGIGLGFDAINSEQSRGTLSRMLAQPIPRDYLINAKFVASLYVISVLLFALAFLVMGIGLIAVGIPPSPEEFARIIIFVLLSIVYVAFWLNLAILFSVRFQQPATSALAGIAVWLFFAIFYPLIINSVAKAMEPASAVEAKLQALPLEQFRVSLLRFSPNVLYSEATTTLLIPSVRSLGPLSMEQVQGAIESALPLGQSILLVWPQVTALIAGTVLCFLLAYVPFMRREIRSR